MQYLDCPRCRARFHAGVIYEPLDRCPRCGAAFDPRRFSLGRALRGALRRPVLREAPDWESITGSQYAARRVRST